LFEQTTTKQLVDSVLSGTVFSQYGPTGYSLHRQTTDRSIPIVTWWR